MSTDPRTTTSAPPDGSTRITRIAVGVDGYAEGRDATVLGATLAAANGAELMLVAVHPDPLIVLPPEVGWTGLHAQAETVLRNTRDELAPGARIDVETDWSVPRALERVVQREHRDLLVVGSSSQGPEGRVRIGTRTRQLLCHSRSTLAVAPRGLSELQPWQIARAGVGFDGHPESQAALSLASSIAQSAGAELIVRGVVDDRLPMVAWSGRATENVQAMWDALLEPELESLRSRAENAATATGVQAEVDVVMGDPRVGLIELSEKVDLLVLGSRRWGAASRVLLGRAGEALMRDAACPVLAVPRPGGA